ncbi:MAG TPA: serine/threonine protein kinase [Polyangia bacterium]|jgi:Ser/Thr protein kinase RdoA (MazF antagonist)
MLERLDTHPLAARFNRLTPDQVFHAVEAEGRRGTGRFIVLNSYENRVYQLELDDGSMVVGKFYRPGRWNRAAILDEHRFLAELAEEEIPTAVPLELTPGETIGEIDGILYALFPRLGGRAPEELSDEQARMLGRLIARIHNVGARADAPHRLRLTPATYGADNLRYLLANEIIPAEARDIYAATVEALLTRIQPLFTDVPVHRLHGDLHLGNLLWTPRGPAVLDFDDLLVGPAGQDVWLIVASADAEGQRQRRVVCEAYAELRDFDPAWLRLVEPLRALRFVHYATWIARRWQDPTFQRTFTYFGTLQYWQSEIQSLREQIARIDEQL